MAAENFEKAGQIFQDAIEIEDPAKRARYLKDACKQDSKLRAEVEALLRSHEKAADFLEAPAVDPNSALHDPPLIEGPGTKIGRYELLELIGEGGMGMVYLAQQKEPVKRKVALKIVKLGMDTRQVVARFEAERQTLALLEHPNIAHVFDAGTTDGGRPYFVMEYVKGRSITRYCDEKKLCIEKRLELFRQVCEGIHHAHQKGIIHRDIKPSNILVSVQDDRPVPKIIDFGIAKAITQPLTEKTSYTEHGQLLGTPEYMSPEQAEMAYQDVDTRSDIYSLGVMLYELLAGATPFDAKRLREGGIDHIQQVICEEEPTTPSARLTSLGDKAKAVAESRRTQIITLTRRLHRELEWIPMKAMRKDRIRRYRSASELADDIQNYLTGTPLIAGPESTVYRARKFVRKHAGSVATAALLLVVIILGLLASILMGCRAEQAREQEAAARVEAEQARDKEAALRAQVEQALTRAENAERIAQEQRKLAEEQRTLAEERAEEYRRSLYFNLIAQAKAAYRNSDIRRLRELLDLCPDDLRAWEWYRLNHLSDQSCMTLRGHAGWVIGISPDGKHIASGSYDNKNTIKVWDTETGAELRTLRGHDGQVVTVSFSPDGRRIVSGDKTGTIRVWDAATGEPLMSLKGHKGPGGGKYCPDGRLIVSNAVDQTFKVWDAETGAELRTWRGHEAPTQCLAISPDNRCIVSGGEDKTVRLWDLATGTEVMTLRGHQGHVNAVAFSPDGKRIISGSRDTTIRVWDAATGEELMTIPGHKDWIHDVVFSPDGRLIASASRDRTVKLWDGSTGAELMILCGHREYVSSVVFSPDGKQLVSGSEDGTIKIWDVALDRERMILAGPQGGEGQGRVAFSPDGARLISITGTGLLKVWDTATGTELTPLRGRRIGLLSAAFSPDGKRIVSGSADNTIKVWDASTGAELMALRGHKGMVVSVGFSPDGRRIVSCGIQDKSIKVWDASTGAELMTLPGHKGYVFGGTFSPDGKRIVAVTSKTLKVWDASTGAELMTLRGHTSVIQMQAVAFSPDGKRIVSGSENGTIKVWSGVSGEELMSVRGHTSRLRSVGFSPDGKRIISGSHDGTLKLWGSASGVEVMTLRGYGSAIFSPDGKTIAFGTTLLEAAAPPNGYGPRRTGAAARKLVDELYDEYGFYEEVIDKLNTDKTLAEPVRKVALQIANARLWEDAGKLNQESEEVVSSPGRDVDAYQGALENAEKANRLEPNTPSVLTALGVARYRVGAYEDALEVLKRPL